MVSACVCALKVDGEDKQRCSPPPLKQKIPAAPAVFGRVLGQDLLYSSYALKRHCFFCIPGQTDLLMVIQYYHSHHGSQCRDWGVPFMTVSLSCLFVCDTSFAVQKLFGWLCVVLQEEVLYK